MTIHTSLATILVPSKDSVFIVNVGDNVAVYNLVGGARARIKIGTDAVIPLAQGKQLVLTKSTSDKLEEINPGKDIQCRDALPIGNYDGIKVFCATFNYPSMLDNLPQLGTLLGSKKDHELSIGKKLLQMTAIEETLNPSYNN